MTSTKSARTSHPAPAAASEPAGAGHQQLAVAAEGAEAMRRGLDAIRRVNDRAIQAALSRMAAAGEKYKEPQQPMQLLAIQSELVRSQIEGATSYWQELSGAALEMQAELLGCSTHLIDTDAVMQTASAVDALPAFPFFPTWGGLRR